jgi:hypothetical protein
MQIRLFPFSASAILLLLCLPACVAQAQEHPSIEFTLVPFADEGGAERMGAIGGKVTGASKDQSIVLYAKSGRWRNLTLHQPYTNRFNLTKTSPGTEYAAL